MHLAFPKELYFFDMEMEPGVCWEYSKLCWEYSK
jgi:hypothetical protein